MRYQPAIEAGNSLAAAAAPADVVTVSPCDLDILTFNLECAVTININKCIDTPMLVYCEIVRYLQNI